MAGSSSNVAFEALADPTRRHILRVLAGNGESSAGQIAAEVDHVGRTGISSHLRILRGAGLVTERRRGRFRLYSLEPSAADEVVEFLSMLYRGSLTDLKRRVEGTVGPSAEPGDG
ncbi:MAG TPA: metalloregulator ArsR/SmtB family transcription factor [Candidatus Dormibacteraeota bacterium]|nr:metalloregulator ArsR/SmtB family transcription factor [Candidatus Dormibacteraeota bacterium]